MTTLIERAREIRATIQNMLVTASDEDILSAPTLADNWNGESVGYTVGMVVRYNDEPYRCLQSHTSQVTWTPTDAPSLWAKILISADGTPLEWVQPDSTNPYMTGDRVLFNGQVYESLIDNNVWSPSAYPQGWQLVEV